MDHFNGDDKRALRLLLAKDCAMILKQPISAISLETPEFMSLRVLHRRVPFVPGKTFVVERKRPVFNAMVAALKRKNNFGLPGINLVQGDICDQIETLCGPHNLFNMDFCGNQCPSVDDCIRSIFSSKSLAADQFLLAITHRNTNRLKIYYQRAGLRIPVSVIAALNNLRMDCRMYGWSIKCIRQEGYIGSANGKRHVNMIQEVWHCNRK